MRVALTAAAMLAGVCPMAAPAWAEEPAATAAAETPVAAASLGGMVGPGLYVTDPERSLRFYTQGLGMLLRMRFGTPGKPDMVVGFGPNPLDAGIMLLSDKDSTPPRRIEHGHGFDRIALRVADLREINARLQAAGFTPGKIQIVHGAIQMMIVTDPDGYRLELIDSKPAPRQSPPPASRP